MNLLRRSLTATALIGTGLACTTGAAFAGDGHRDDSTEQTGLVNISDTQTIIPVNACGNNVPVNVLGVQVPIQDVVGTVPILSPAEGGSEQSAGIREACANAVEADN